MPWRICRSVELVKNNKQGNWHGNGRVHWCRQGAVQVRSTAGNLAAATSSGRATTSTGGFDAQDPCFLRNDAWARRLLFASELEAADDEIIAPTRIENVRVRDGVNIAVAVYLPKDAGRYPTLFAASPYRFDNNLLPPTPQFLWRETGPIEWYLDHGYAFVHMDVRGTGRSDGDFRFLGQQGAARLLRRDRVDRAAAMVRRQGRRHRAVLLRDDAVVHGERRSRRISPASRHTTG